MNVAMQFRFIDDQFIVSGNDSIFFKGDKIYFMGKIGGQQDEYCEIIKEHTKTDKGLEVITFEDFKNLSSYDKSFLIIYFDTPFINKIDKLILEDGWDKEELKEVMEEEKEKFKDIEKLLKKHQHIIVQ